MSHNLWLDLDPPLCIDCGPRPQECWNTCGGNDGVSEWKGFCNKCDTASGKTGACCLLGSDGDPEECKKVPPESFIYTDYHTCVTVPGIHHRLFYSFPFSGAPLC